MLLKKTTQQVLLIAVLILTNNIVQGQNSKTHKYKLNVAIQTVLDLDYSVPGIAFESKDKRSKINNWEYYKSLSL
jgi:hypothetical protein